MLEKVRCAGDCRQDDGARVLPELEALALPSYLPDDDDAGGFSDIDGIEDYADGKERKDID